MSHLITAKECNDWLKDASAIAIRVLMKDPVSGAPDDCHTPALPQSVDFDLDGAGSDHNTPFPHTLPDQATLCAVLGEHGIDASRPVIVYDNRGVYCAPRLWWMLKSLGHKDVRLLNGGIAGWVDAGFETSTALTPKPESRYQADPQPGWFVGAHDIVNAMSTETQIVDARSPGRFAGTAAEPRPGLRSGHIPGSLNLYYQDLIVDGCFKPTDALQTLFDRAGIDTKKPIICTCGSGITACIVGMAALMLGADAVSVYDGSWAEWGSQSQYPVEKSA